MSEALLTERKELHNLIDTLPERKLKALRPLLDVLTEDELIIETDLTDEEKKWIEEGDRQFKEHPEDFVTLDSLLK